MGLRKLVPVGGTANYPYILKAHEPPKVLVPGMSLFMPSWTIHRFQGLVFPELTGI